MKALDRVIQHWRIAKVRRYIPPGARVLDIGCDDGAIFRQVRQIGEGIGIDPFIAESCRRDGYILVKGWFPDDLPTNEPFDIITLLAVLEHIPADRQGQLAEHIAHFLKPGGRLVITVPSPLVDRILAALKFLRLIDGMSLEQHYQFDAGRTPAIFEGAGLMVIRHKRFQAGLNNLFVFEKQAPSYQVFHRTKA